MRHTITVAICVIVSLVLGAIATQYVHPHWLFGIIYTLQLHAAAACVLAMIVALIVRRHPVVWLLFLLSVAQTAHSAMLGLEHSSPLTAAEAKAPTFRLLSYNIFDDNLPNADRLAQFIMNSGADVVNIMEASPIGGKLDEIAKVYPYRIGCGVQIQECDQLMLSKTPIRTLRIASLSDIFPDRFILARMDIGNHNIVLTGIHTTKPYFDSFHMVELRTAMYALNETKGMLLLSGDFNASSLAPDMRWFLDRTGLKTGGWEPSTWPIRARDFGVAIDHVYARAPLKVKSVTRIPDAMGSNHYGLMAEIAITGEN